MQSSRSYSGIIAHQTLRGLSRHVDDILNFYRCYLSCCIPAVIMQAHSTPQLNVSLFSRLRPSSYLTATQLGTAELPLLWGTKNRRRLTIEGAGSAIHTGVGRACVEKRATTPVGSDGMYLIASSCCGPCTLFFFILLVFSYILMILIVLCCTISAMMAFLSSPLHTHI